MYLSTTYNLTGFSASMVFDKHKSVLTPSDYKKIMWSSICLTFIGFRRCRRIHINIDSLRIHRSVRSSLIYSTHKIPYTYKQGFQKYCEAAYSRSGIYQMWILKNSKELLDHLKSQKLNLTTNIKSFEFSTLKASVRNTLQPLCDLSATKIHNDRRCRRGVTTRFYS